MRKVDEVHYYVYNNQKYKVNVIFKNNLHSYFKEINGEFFLCTNVVNFKCSKMENFILESIAKFSNLKPKNKKPLLDIDWLTWSFYLFGKKIYFTYEHNFINLLNNDNNLIAKIKCLKLMNIRKKLWEYLKHELEIKFIELTNFYMNIILKKRFDVKIKISCKKSAWATNYVNKKQITVSQFLVFYNLKYIEYVALHEIAHFVEQNHSSAFWKIVSKFCSNYKEIRNKLNNHIYD